MLVLKGDVPLLAPQYEEPVEVVRAHLLADMLVPMLVKDKPLGAEWVDVP